MLSNEWLLWATENKIYTLHIYKNERETEFLEEKCIHN